MAGVFVFLGAFVTYAFTASPTLGWLDAPELAAASATLGVPHSPGHPLSVFVGTVFTLLPIGDAASRSNLASAACAAAAAVGIYAAAVQLYRRVDRNADERTVSAAAVGSALIASFAWALWFQAVRTEVYALETALVAGALAALLAHNDAPMPRWLLVSALLLGLGLANHHFITLTVLLPGAVFILASRRRPSARLASLTATLGIIGLAAIVYLPARAAQHPVVNWGAPSTASRLFWTISGRAFHKNLAGDHVSTPLQDAAQILAAYVEQATPLMALLALLGAILGLVNPHWRAPAGLLLAIAVTTAAARMLVGFDSQTPDHLAYLAPGLIAILLLAGAGLFELTKRARASRLAAVVLLLTAAWQLARTYDSASLRHAYAAEEMAHWQLETLPPRTLLLPGYFQTSFRLQALRAIEHARPDIAILDRSFLTYPGAQQEALRAHPDLAALIEAPLRADAPTPIEQLRRLATQRPVLVELHPNLDAAARPWLLPAGPFAYFAPRPPREADRRRTETLDRQARAELERRLQAPQPAERAAIVDALLWHDFVRARHFCDTGRRRAAADALASARALASADTMLADMVRECSP